MYHELTKKSDFLRVIYKAVQMMNAGYFAISTNIPTEN